ncbi:MAG TPA: imidazoleglycerol-phosphate dehydratase HisB [Anaerovoracaceae bacterium]|nr:imidazoleglycerol-phosphate dehydratase HisB [Anaerovoracaceae bacterium]
MRKAEIERSTKETEISISLSVDGEGTANIDTGIGFFDHMLTAFCYYGNFDIDLSCKGDLHVDSHHTVEDVGIVLGNAFLSALGDKKGIRRFGSFTIPMDEALVNCNLDISNRPYLVFNVDFTADKIGDLDTQMVREFFYAFAMNSRITLHINQSYGDNDHHIAEAAFKALGQALKIAVERTENNEILSTKGCL